MQNIVILGSTGSVGQSTLEVLARHPQQFTVYALTANSNVEKILNQCIQFQPKIVVMVQTQAAGLGNIVVKHGAESLVDLVTEQQVDTVMSAIVGAAGLMPTLRAVQSAKRVLIANKEPLVMTGDLFMREAANSGAVVLPIDSEHNAIFQCLPDNQNKRGVNKIHLTASGGPFRGRQWADLNEITPEQACAHPNWSMGRKISVDSATMMNKGLELIEAAALFGLSADRVDIVVHPQSIIHSMVEYDDGSFLAQLGAPDMKIPIAHALAWPDRINSGAKTLDITDIARLDFQKPDMANLPCLALARHAAVAGGSAPAVLNAANEIAVEAFLQEVMIFTDIPNIIDKTLQAMPVVQVSSIDDVLQIDHEARQIANQALKSFSRD
ncbi:UNVERIFIED_CONTAM: hypothetical protein GTU68_031293 [Idotea baltica]|nr:hypothetical protein [Idotea baltica]